MVNMEEVIKLKITMELKETPEEEIEKFNTLQEEIKKNEQESKIKESMEDER